MCLKFQVNTILISFTTARYLVASNKNDATRVVTEPSDFLVFYDKS